MLKRKLQILRLMLCGNGYRRAKYLKKINHFRKQGDNCFFIPFNYGTEPYMLSFGDNVYVASGVRFVTHDVTAQMFRNIDAGQCHTSRVGPIEVGNHVFIGAGVTVLYDVKIGDRVIVAAGALVNRDLPGGGVYGGVPARKLFDFDEYMERSREYSKRVPWKDSDPLETRKRLQLEYLYPDDEEKEKLC